MNATDTNHTGGFSLDRLSGRLARRAASEGLLDVAYTVHDSRIGPLLMVATDRGLVRVAFEREGHERVLDEIARKLSPRVLRSPGRLDEARRELDEYLDGKRHGFDVPLDWTLNWSGFRRRALEEVAAIPYGEVRTYTQVARVAGNERASRAAGTACATNQLPLFVPCHRVVRIGGGLGNYGGGIPLKEHLLELEGATVT
jgi:methylated-DNA-[protein]-cysteine S-methyltransferase